MIQKVVFTANAEINSSNKVFGFMVFLLLVVFFCVCVNPLNCSFIPGLYFLCDYSFLLSFGVCEQGHKVCFCYILFTTS